MRIRSIKPEFWRSRDITSLPVPDRLLFVGLWSYVDDNGVGRDEEPSIIADLFADDMFRDSRETVARVSRGLQTLSDAGLIARYTHDGRPFLYITTWESHQRIDRPAKPRFPRPDADRVILATVPRESRDTPATGAGEQRNRGTEEQEQTLAHSQASEPARSTPTRFEEFWQAYPRRVGKQTAKAKYAAAVKRASEDDVIDGAHRLASDPNLPEVTFIPHPATWLARNGWEDEPLPSRARTSDRQGDILRGEMERAIVAEAARAARPRLEIAQ